MGCRLGTITHQDDVLYRYRLIKRVRENDDGLGFDDYRESDLNNTVIGLTK